MIKTAIPLVGILGKIAPKLTALTGKVINEGSAKLIGSAAGALTGGAIGSSMAPEGAKTKGFVVGAATGGFAGHFAGKTIAGFGVGGVDSARLKGFSNELTRLSTSPTQTTADSLRDMGKYVSKNFATAEHLKPISRTNVEGPVARPWLGVMKQAPVQALDQSPRGTLLKAIGNTTRNIMSIADKGTAADLGITGKNMLTRTTQVLGREAQEAMHYTKDGFRYRRSVPGKVLGATLGSGIGMGALQGATTTNPDGSPAPTYKKLFRGTASALGWGLATPFMGAKAIAYDIPKTIINPES
jgi:hypothetical protein